MKKGILIFIVLTMCLKIYSQVNYKLGDYIFHSINSTLSIQNKKARIIHEKENLLFKRNFFPEASLDFTLPSYNRSISDIIQPDGTFAFRESNNANSRINLSISQKIPFTGGQLFIMNSFNRLDLFGDVESSTSYSASWFGINLTQPLNFFNAMKWDKKIQNALVEYNAIDYKSKNVDIKKEAVTYFFELLQIKSQKRILEKEMQVSKKMKIAYGILLESGKIMSYDTIDLALRMLDTKRKLKFISKSEILKIERINNFFGSKIVNSNDKLEIPKLPVKLLNLNKYIDEYLNINMIIEKNKLLSLEKTIEQLQKNRFYKASFSVGLGFNNSSKEYREIFLNPNQSQSFSVSLNVPLIDFGRKRIQLEISKIKYESEVLIIDQVKYNTIERIKLLYEEIYDLNSGLEIEVSRIALLDIKLQRMEVLLLAQKVLYRDYSELENELYNSINDRINMLRLIYDKIIELEKLTLLEII